MNSSTTLPSSHLHFENTIGRLLVHPTGQYIAIEYHPGPRQPSELKIFLTQVGNMIARWGWDKLLTAHTSMADFTSEEIADISTYWRTSTTQQSGILYGALLLPHAVFACLSWKGNMANTAVLMPS